MIEELSLAFGYKFMNSDIHWKQYSLYVDLYKFYVEIVIKFNLFYYAITGALLSFYLSHKDIPYLKLSLGLPILMSIAFAGVFFYGGQLMHVLRLDVFALRDKLSLATAPDLGILTVILNSFGVLFLLISVSIIFLCCI